MDTCTLELCVHVLYNPNHSIIHDVSLPLFLSPPCLYSSPSFCIMSAVVFSRKQYDHIIFLLTVLFCLMKKCSIYLNWEGVTDLLWFAVIHLLWVWIITVTLNLLKSNIQSIKRRKDTGMNSEGRKMGEIKYSMSVFSSQFLLST